MRRALVICLASSAAWAVATPAFAQMVATATTTSPEHQLDEIIVTAQKRSESAQSVPLAITAISGKELQSAGINSIEGVSESIPNVEFGSNAADSKVFIRGVGYDSVSAGGEPRVAIYSNNVYESQTQAAFLTLYDIDRVEVLRGPQGTLYGRNAVAGAINIITNDSGSQLNGYVAGQTGNYGLIQTEGAVGGPINQWLSARVAFQTVDRDGYGHNIGTGEQVDDDHSKSVRLTLVAKPTDNIQDRFVADYFYERDHKVEYHYLGESYPGVVPTPVLLGERVPTNFLDYGGQEPLNNLQAYGVSNELTVDLNRLLTLTSVTGYRNLSSDLVSNNWGSTLNLIPLGLFENSNAVSQEVRLSGDNDHFKYVIGGYYFHESQAVDTRAPFSLLIFGTGPADQFVQFYNAGGFEKTNAYAGFGQVDAKIVSGLTLSLGLRYSKETKDLREFATVDFTTPYDTSLPLTPNYPTTGLSPQTASWSSTDPRLSLSYQFDPRVIGYVTYSQGFKSGGFNIGGLQPPFDPERIKDYEAGLKGDFLDGRLRANVAAFYYDYSNLQVNIVKNFNPQTLNAATAKVKGVEGEFTALPTTHLRVSLSAAWLDAYYTQFETADPARVASGVMNLAGHPLNYAPHYKVAGSVGYTIPSPYGDFTPTADVTWTDRVYFSPFETPLLSQPAHANLDLFLRWVGKNPDWTGSLFLRNATDKIYITGAGVGNSAEGYYRAGQLSAPRTFGIQVTRHF
jgi:iron complex outermembrane receptor protein